MDTLDTLHGSLHKIRRQHVFEDCLELYSKQVEVVLIEFPFPVRFVHEKAVDTGGVSRDMFSAFCEEAYLATFDGGKLLVPSLHPGSHMAKFLGPSCPMEFFLVASFLFSWLFPSWLPSC